MNLEQKKKKIESLIALIPIIKIYPEYHAKALFKLNALKKEMQDSDLIKANKELFKSNYK